MAIPTVAVNTTNLDASTDSPASARADLLDLVNKFNALIAALSTTPTANFIPIADALGKLANGWLNTGSGNGLDADKLDGNEGAYYAPIDSPSLTGTPTAPTPTAGDSSTKIATTAFVAGFAGGSWSFTVPGYIKLANGFEIKWGSLTGTALLQTVTFATPFSTSCFAVSLTANNAAAAAGTPYVTAYPVTGFTIAYSAAPLGTPIKNIAWIAFGY